jgi:DNA end-binding protein Ku
MSARPIWKGLLQISLVTVPIKVFPATESPDGLKFNQLHAPADHTPCRIQQKTWCPSCDRQVPAAELVKGYEFEVGKFVILQPEELEAVAPLSTKVIDLVRFAEASALPWRAIDRAYYLAPDGPDGGPAQAAYAILVEAMAGQLGLGTLAIYGREYLVAVSPKAGALLLYTLHHAAEWRPVPYTAPDPRAVRGTFTLPAAEVTLAQRVIMALTGPLDLAAFTDQMQGDLRRLIDAKVAGEEIVEPVPIDTPPVGNLRDALTQSLAAVRATKGPKAAKVSLETGARKRA